MSTVDAPAPAVRLPFETPNELFDHRNPSQFYCAAIEAVWDAYGLSNDDRSKISNLIRAANTEAWSRGYRDGADVYMPR